MTALLEPPARAAALLRDNPVNDLRRLEVIETDSDVTITGIVTSYYLKQMAQEAVRPALAGRRLRNKVIVLAAEVVCQFVSPHHRPRPSPTRDGLSAFPSAAPERLPARRGGLARQSLSPPQTHRGRSDPCS